MITQLYTVQIAGEEILKYAREKDPETGEERLLKPYELEDPDDVDVGDEFAYKVSILKPDPEDDY